jgi:hypothetical protein
VWRRPGAERHNESAVARTPFLPASWPNLGDACLSPNAGTETLLTFSCVLTSPMLFPALPYQASLQPILSDAFQMARFKYDPRNVFDVL